MKTPHSNENQAFTDSAHSLAKSLIYPAFFGVKPSAITWAGHNVADGGVSAVLDGQLGVDRTAKVMRDGHAGVFTTSVQERFRRMRYERFRDITITKENKLSGQLSELYKLQSGLFVYGYCDVDESRFGEVVIVNVEILMDAISRKVLDISEEENPRTRQTFVTVKIDRLLEVPGLVRWHRRPGATFVSQIARARPYWSGASHKSCQVQSRFSFVE